MNGTLIQEDERRGAEYDYLKKYCLEYLRVENTEEREKFLIEHNRYLELIESKYKTFLCSYAVIHSKNKFITQMRSILKFNKQVVLLGIYSSFFQLKNVLYT